MTPRAYAWMRQAKSDWAVAELTAQQGFHSQACYHYGQSAEKALNALLISLGSLPPYSHALDRLVDSLEAGGVDVSSISCAAQGVEPHDQQNAVSERERSPGRSFRR